MRMGMPKLQLETITKLSKITISTILWHCLIYSNLHAQNNINASGNAIIIIGDGSSANQSKVDDGNSDLIVEEGSVILPAAEQPQKAKNLGILPKDGLRIVHFVDQGEIQYFKTKTTGIKNITVSITDNTKSLLYGLADLDGSIIEGITNRGGFTQMMPSKEFLIFVKGSSNGPSPYVLKIRSSDYQ